MCFFYFHFTNYIPFQAGKAVVLTKTADYIEKLRSERENIQDEADKLQSEINELNASIR